MSQEIHTLVLISTEVGNTISSCFMVSALNQLGRINAEIVDGQRAAIIYDQLNTMQRDKIDKYVAEHNCSVFYIEFDPALMEQL